MSEQSSPYVSRPESPKIAGSKRAHEASSTSNAENLKPYACVTCSRRKVRCDKREPCSTCQKSGTECVFRAPAPPQPRKRRAPETILLERLKRAEDLLTGLGVKVDPGEIRESRPLNQRSPIIISTVHSTGLQARSDDGGPVAPAGQTTSRFAAPAEAIWGEGRSNFIRK